MKIGEVARRSGLSAHTLRYYERIGLIPYAERDVSGQRDCDASILTWLAFLERLKTTGMPIRDMLRYAALRDEGSTTGAQRCRLLAAHRTKVQGHVAALQACLLVLDTKIAGNADDEPTASNDETETRGREQVRSRMARTRGHRRCGR